MLDKDTLEKYDRSGMFQVYDRWPEIARDAYERDLRPVDFGEIDHIVFAGMGGSGTIGDLFLSALSKTPVHVTVVKGYLLPKTVNSKTLVVAVSASGDTVETLTVVRSAKDLGCRMICFSSGGMLEQYCSRNAIEHRHVQVHNNPRSSFPSLVYSVLKALPSVISIDEPCVRRSIRQLGLVSKKISTANLGDTNPSVSLARWLGSAVPVIYFPWGLQAAAIRFKNSIQENMKSHAMTEDVIEACHNGIVSWEGRGGRVGGRQMRPVFIRGRDDYHKTKERWGILADYFNERGVDFWEVRSIGSDVLSKIITLVYQLDFATVYGAVLGRTDPNTIHSIGYIKGRLTDL